MQKGDAVSYRSFGGDLYDAIITGIRPAGFVDVDLTGPHLKEPYALTGVRWSDDPESKLPGARPKRTG